MKRTMLICFMIISTVLFFISCGKESPTAPSEPPQSKWAPLTIKSDPSEAEIWFCGANTELKTPATIPEVSLGDHSVLLTKPDFMNFHWLILMEPAGLTYDVDLAPGTGDFFPEPVEDANINKIREFNISADYFGNWHCAGELKNFGGRWADYIKITFSLYDTGGNIIDTANTYCNGRCGTSNTGLKPAQEGSFELETSVEFNKVVSYKYDISWVTRGYGVSSQDIHDLNLWLQTKSLKFN